jgi:hypothetical protein
MRAELQTALKTCEAEKTKNTEVEAENKRLRSEINSIGQDIDQIKTR